MNTPDYSHNVYPYGSWPVTTAEFRDENGDLINPATVTLDVYAPDESTTEYTFSEDSGLITRSSIGEYAAVVQAEQAGIWICSWHDENGLAFEDIFEIDISPLMEGGL